MSFNLDTFKEKLKSKGISIQAEADCVIAGLSWWVEGIEKAPKLGDLLFYVVNGTRYGVKPSKKAKHDIEWYYDQLKTGMKGAKGYSAGLTQFLNAWVKKGELDIVFKGKVKASEIGASAGSEVVNASPQLVSETGIRNLLYDKKLKAVKESNVLHGFIWKFKNAEIRYKEGDDVAYVFYVNDSGSRKLNAECTTIAELSTYIDKHLKTFTKITAEVCEVKETLSEVNKENFEGINKDYEDFKQKVEDIVFFGKKPFTVDKGERYNEEWVYIGTKKPILVKSNKAFEENLSECMWQYLAENAKPVEKQILLYSPESERVFFNDGENGCTYYMYSINHIDFDKVYNILKDNCKEIEKLAGRTEGGYTVEAEKINSEVNKENFEGINQDHDRLMYMKVSPKDFITLWKTSTKFNPTQLNKIVFGFKLASRILGSKFEDSGIKIEYFFKRQDGKGYIRVEYKNELYIIYVSQSDENGDIKVVTRKMKKMIPVKNFNLLSTSVSSLAFENATLPPNFKKVWEEVSKD